MGRETFGAAKRTQKGTEGQRISHARQCGGSRFGWNMPKFMREQYFAD